MTKPFLCTGFEPVVQTREGALRGFRFGSTFHFYGVTYATAKRFMPPKPVAPWDGIKDALSYGYTAPLLEDGNPAGDIFSPHRFWPQSEDCLSLNIWTQNLDPSANLPVMVWLHGGGYMAGSSIEMPAYDGKNLSEFGNVVVVTLNHRLNVLGFLDLSEFGEAYKNSGNAGLADIVAALTWIKENIASFGGDPNNVTLFGQSGGSGKIHDLMQVPAADALFNRGITQSGTSHEGELPLGSTESCTMLAKEIMKSEGLSSVEELQALPWERLKKACISGMELLQSQGVITGWGPKVNDWFLGDGIDYPFTEAASKKPVMVGSTFAEFSPFSVPEKHNLSKEESLALLKKRFGDKTEAAVALFSKAYPDKHITDLLSLDTFLRRSILDFLDRRASLCEAETFSYLFAFDFPYEGGKTSWHCAEIPFVFHNAENIPICNQPPVSQKLENEICGAWVNFARNGNPNHKDLPLWTPYTKEQKATMVFSDNTRLAAPFDEELISFLVENFNNAPAFAVNSKKDDK